MPPKCSNPSDEICGREGCTAKVAIKMCRGTANVENRGFFYKACTKPPGSSHFIGWVSKPRQQVDTLVEDMPVSQLTMQHLLQLPLTPPDAGHHPSASALSASTPSVSALSSSTPTTSTPSRFTHSQHMRKDGVQAYASKFPVQPIVSAFSSSIDDIYEEAPATIVKSTGLPTIPSSAPPSNPLSSSLAWCRSASNAAALLASAAMAASSEALPSSSATTPLSVNLASSHSATAATTADGGAPPCPSSTPSLGTGSELLDSVRNHVYEREHTRTVIKNGKAITACNGPTCQTREPVRNCSTCTHQFCLKCCLHFQKAGAALCTQPTHQPPTPSMLATASTAVVENVNPTHRPLRQDHYEAKESAQKHWEQKANQLVRQKQATDLLHKVIRIVYWKDADDPTTLMIPCATHPIFNLSLCSPTELKIFGYQSGSNADFLIETFDLSQGSNGRWVLHNLSTPRDVSCHPTLLYRQRDVPNTAADMVVEMETLRAHRKSRKGPTTSLFAPLLTNTTTSSGARIVASEMDDSTPPPIPLPTIAKSETSKRKAEKSKAESSISSKKAKVDLSDVDSDVEMVHDMAPSSKHSHWPFRYVRPMVDGFQKMETMEHETRGRNGTIQERFTAAFDCGFPGSKKTFFSQRDCWKHADPKLIEEYYDAGCTRDGLWKNFRKEVLNNWDGKVPGSGRRGQNTKAKALVVKKEAKQMRIKIEDEVIVIDSD